MNGYDRKELIEHLRTCPSFRVRVFKARHYTMCYLCGRHPYKEDVKAFLCGHSAITVLCLGCAEKVEREFEEKTTYSIRSILDDFKKRIGLK